MSEHGQGTQFTTNPCSKVGEGSKHFYINTTKKVLNQGLSKSHWGDIKEEGYSSGQGRVCLSYRRQPLSISHLSPLVGGEGGFVKLIYSRVWFCFVLFSVYQDVRSHAEVSKERLFEGLKIAQDSSVRPRTCSRPGT